MSARTDNPQGTGPARSVMHGLAGSLTKSALDQIAKANPDVEKIKSYVNHHATDFLKGEDGIDINDVQKSYRSAVREAVRDEDSDVTIGDALGAQYDRRVTQAEHKAERLVSGDKLSPAEMRAVKAAQETLGKEDASAQEIQDALKVINNGGTAPDADETDTTDEPTPHDPDANDKPHGTQALKERADGLRAKITELQEKLDHAIAAATGAGLPDVAKQEAQEQAENLKQAIRVAREKLDRVNDKLDGAHE